MPADVDPLPISVDSVEVENGAEIQIDALDEVSFQTVSAHDLFDAQLTCPEVVSHQKGQHPRTINMAFVEVAPDVQLYCDMSTGRARPLVPNGLRHPIFRLFHMLLGVFHIT